MPNVLIQYTKAGFVKRRISNTVYMDLWFYFPQKSQTVATLGVQGFPTISSGCLCEKATQLINSQAVQLLQTGKYCKAIVVIRMTCLWKNEKDDSK